LGNERPAAGTVLNEVENYLTQLETLLALPARSEPSTSDLALAPTHSVDSMGNSIAVPDLPLILTGPSDHQIPVADLAPAVELELELEQKPVIPDETLSSGLPTPDLGEYPNFALDSVPHPNFALDSVPPVASEEIDLIDLLGLKEADPEFIEVFLEEARGELIAIREQLINWRSNFNDRDALTTIRRAFHTLKGSGRMVGATVIGDFAWEYENLLNQVLSGTLNPSMALCDAVAAAVSALAPLVGEIPPRGGELDVLPTLIAQCLADLDRPSEKSAFHPGGGSGRTAGSPCRIYRDLALDAENTATRRTTAGHIAASARHTASERGCGNRSRISGSLSGRGARGTGPHSRTTNRLAAQSHRPRSLNHDSSGLSYA